MNTKSIKVAIVCLCCCFSSSWAYSQDRYLTRSKDGVEYYLVGSRPIKRLGSTGAQYEAWLISKPAPNKISACRLEMITSRNKYNLKADGYEHYSHSLMKYQFDCQRDKIRLMDRYDYNTEGTVLSSFPKGSFNDWQETIPESVSEGLFQEICKIANN